jgi:hypothetical protein
MDGRKKGSPTKWWGIKNLKLSDQSGGLFLKQFLALIATF